MEINVTNNNYWDYSDVIIYDLLRFLNENINSNEVAEKCESNIDYQDVTKLYSLFEDDQLLYFYCDDKNVSLARLDNDKLLIIESLSDNDRTYFSFELLPNASYYKIDVDKNKKTLKLNNGKEQIVFYSITNASSRILPKIFGVGGLKPVNIEQLFEKAENLNIREREILKSLRR